MAIAIKTPEVLKDLDQIVEYIASDNLSAALHWLDEIEGVFTLLASQPYMGRELHTKRLGLVRRHVFGN
jgi:plasmid stabilization system protein ParE